MGQRRWRCKLWVCYHIMNFTPRWRKAILDGSKPKHEKSMANVYVNNLNFEPVRLCKLFYTKWSKAMPHVSKPDRKSGWEVVNFLKMEKHPSKVI